MSLGEVKDIEDKDFKVTKTDAEEQRVVLTPDGYIAVFSLLKVKGIRDSEGEHTTVALILTYLKKGK
jgi:hypothetical protein